MIHLAAVPVALLLAALMLHRRYRLAYLADEQTPQGFVRGARFRPLRVLRRTVRRMRGKKETRIPWGTLVSCY